MASPSEYTLRIGDVAEQLGRPHDYVRDLVKYGDLDCFWTRGGHRRFRQKDIDIYLRKSARQGVV